MIHAFVSDGRLYLRTDDGQIREIDSPFANEKRERMERQKSGHGWMADQDASHFSSAILWGKMAPSSGASYRFTDVAPAGERCLYYTMSNGVVTGLFRYDLDDDFETRLFHKNSLQAAGLDFSKVRNELVIATEGEDLRSHLELLDERGSHVRSLTSGDVIDSNPSFSYSNQNMVVFQSSEIMRNDEGYVVCMGPASIQSCSLDTDQITELYSDRDHDLMLPRQDAEGNLYCIRRPYKKPYSVSPLHILVSIVTFPVRFCLGIIGFLNAFTELFSRPLLKPDGPVMQAPERQKYVRVLGETIHLAKLYRSSYYRKDISMVPRSWELIKIDKARSVKVLARNVASYDIDAKGDVCYTNGFKVTGLSQAGMKGLFDHSLIQRIRAGEKTQAENAEKTA